MQNYQNRLVIITGAAHGIGFSLAQLYEKAGAKVVVIDVSQNAIAKAKTQLKKSVFYQCDITNREELYGLAKKILKQHGTPYFLINNAGVVENSFFLNCSDEVLERTMQVNIVSHFWMLKAFLPSMIERKEGQICQVASAAGIMGVKGLVSYCASKHAVVGFSNALRLELDDITKGKIPVTIVCPSFINTGMFKGVKPARWTPLLDQEKIAKIIFQAVDRRKEFVLEPFMVKTIPLLKALLSVKGFNVITNFFKVNHAMDDILKNTAKKD